MIRHRLSILLFACALLVGLLIGFVGSLFQLMVDAINLHRHALIESLYQLHIPPWLSATLISGAMVAVSAYLITSFAKEAGGSGVQEIEGAVKGLRPTRWKRVLPVKFIGGLFSLGSGMVMGREGPTIQMGGNLGKMVSEFFHLTRDKTDILISAGAAAGLATAFNAPLAGIIFVIEEMREGFANNFTSVKAVFISCVVATIVLRGIVGNQPAIVMEVYNTTPDLSYLLMFISLGLIVGFVGLLFNKALMGSLNQIQSFQVKHFVLYAAIAGSIIGFLGWYAPDLTGGGYAIIEKALHFNMAFIMLSLLLVFRFGTTILSYSSGIPGGIFAPMLALGTLLGIAYGNAIDYLFALPIPNGMFAVAGMGALFAACVQAPVTGIILIVEMTQNYLLIVPIMLTCLAATSVVFFANNPPIYDQLLARTLRIAKQREEMEQ